MHPHAYLRFRGGRNIYLCGAKVQISDLAVPVRPLDDTRWGVTINTKVTTLPTKAGTTNHILVIQRQPPQSMGEYTFPTYNLEEAMVPAGRAITVDPFGHLMISHHLKR